MGQSNNPIPIDNARVDFSGASSGFASAGVGGQNILHFPTGRSARMENVRRTIEEIAGSMMPVLITGEQGTGKEWAARYLHSLSPRADRPFIAIDCNSVPADLLEIEIFGHAKGAVSGANSARTGRIEAAEGGSIFLDELAILNSSLQEKLLHVLRKRTYKRVGGNRNRECDIRIITAATIDGKFPERQFKEPGFGLDVLSIELPPLRQRIDDLAELVDSIRARCSESGLNAVELTPGALRILMHYDWPGNVRELSDLIERLCILFPGGRVDIMDLPAKLTANVPLRVADRDGIMAGRASGPQPQDIELPKNSVPLKRYLESIEIALIGKALRETDGVIAHAARYLELRRTTLAEKMKRYGIRSSEDTESTSFPR